MIQQTRQFEIRRCVGRGGFGEVYQAVMVSAGGLRKDVAIKTLLGSVVADSDSVRRLRDEARLLAALDHRAILTVYDLVVLEGRIALVMEYVSGADLGECLGEPDPLPIRAAVETIGEIAGALDAAYTTPSPEGGGPLHLIHRDIKPSNIRLSAAGNVKLLDFGIARSPNIEREAKTGTGLIIGTIGYLAPERLVDERLEPSSDVFALGCVLYEAVARRRFYENASMREITRMAIDEHVHDAFLSRRLAELPTACPAPLKELLRQILAHEPDARPTAAVLERECEDLMQHCPGDTVRGWARRRTWADPEGVQGDLDGRVITEATLLTARASDAQRRQASAELPPPAPSSSTGRLALLVGGAGAIGAVGAVVLVAVIGLTALVASWQAPTPEVSTSPSTIGTAAGQTAPQSAPEPLAPEAAPLAADRAEPEPDPLPEPTSPVVASPKASAAPKRADPPPSVPPAAVAPAVATVTVSGGTEVELRGSAGRFRGGEVPAGAYELWADFDGGFTKVQPVELVADGAVTIRCSRVTLDCRISSL